MARESGTLLIVDDEENVRNLLKRALEGAGYEVVTATNGQEALDKASQLNIEMVLLDIKMPGIPGMEVLRQLTTNWPEICVIMATAVAEAQTAVEAMKLGAYDYITKPFNLDDVVLTVRRAIEKKHLQMENERHRLALETRVGEQTQQLQQQFIELVETLAREHKLIYRLAHSQRGGKEELSKLPKELQKPMSSVEEFSEALIRILRRGPSNPSYRTSTNAGKGPKR